MNGITVFVTEKSVNPCMVRSLCPIVYSFLGRGDIGHQGNNSPSIAITCSTEVSLSKSMDPYQLRRQCDADVML